MKVKTAEASGKVLAYLVACVELTTFPSLKHLEYPDDAPWFLHPDGTIRSAQEIPSNAMSRQYDYTFWSPSTDWAQGGPIIEREKIGVLPDDGHRFSQWRAFCWHPSQHDLTFEDATSHMEAGSTLLIAAMRCFVASRLGDEVDVPEELLQ